MKVSGRGRSADSWAARPGRLRGGPADASDRAQNRGPRRAVVTGREYRGRSLPVVLVRSSGAEVGVRVPSGVRVWRSGDGAASESLPGRRPRAGGPPFQCVCHAAGQQGVSTYILSEPAGRIGDRVRTEMRSTAFSDWDGRQPPRRSHGCFFFTERVTAWRTAYCGWV